MKKWEKIINKICTLLVVGIIGGFLWDTLVSELVPWTRTVFFNHQSYIQLLQNEGCIGGSCFSEDKPIGACETKYYWHRDFVERYAAYSMVLTDEEYATIAEIRLKDYWNEFSERKDVIKYILQEGQYLYIEDSCWYDEEKLAYINKVMQNPETQQQYHFGVVLQNYTSTGIVYSGVILNDITHELIEFSAELRDDTQPYCRRLFWGYEDFIGETKKTFFQRDLPDSADDMEYYLYKDMECEKYGYHVTLSEEAYNAVKEERAAHYDMSELKGKLTCDREENRQYVDWQQLSEKGIDFLKENLVQENADCYYILRSVQMGSGEDYLYNGVLCNDKACEIIEFSCAGDIYAEDESDFFAYVTLVTALASGLGVVYIMTILDRKLSTSKMRKESEKNKF